MTKKFNFRISDHVLLRYMERMLGVDVAAFRKRLHDELAPAAQAGAAQIEINNMIFKFSHWPDEVTVTTMWPSGSPKPWKQPRKGLQDSKDYNRILARKRMAK